MANSEKRNPGKAQSAAQRVLAWPHHCAVGTLPLR